MLLTDSSRYGCTSLSYRWSLCLCARSAVKFALPLILLSEDHWHICIGVTRFSSECFSISWGLIRVLKLHRVTEGLAESQARGACAMESRARFFRSIRNCFPPPPSPTCLSRRTARWTAREAGMWLVPTDRVALPRKERSQQSNLLTALRCVSAQVLLSAIPQVLIYQLSVQTEHRPRLYFCLLL